MSDDPNKKQGQGSNPNPGQQSGQQRHDDQQQRDNQQKRPTQSGNEGEDMPDENKQRRAS